MDKILNLEYISKLVNYHNKLVRKFDIPLGDMQVQLDDGYVGEVYAIDFEYNNGTFVVAIDENDDLCYSVLYSNNESSHGKIADHTDQEISDMIKKVRI